MTDAKDPVQLFLDARERARAAGEPWHATSCVLATIGDDGAPKARTVLVKDVDEAANGAFHLFTNYRSDKGRELAADPRAALCFHFRSVDEQFRVEGGVEKASAAVSDAYFQRRPRLSQVGAWASDQSEPIDSRAALEAKVREVEARYDGQPVPRPPHWGGYVLRPTIIEHWVEGEGRLHDRVRYRWVGGEWRGTRLQP